jgi:hypothetical protein
VLLPVAMNPLRTTVFDIALASLPESEGP